MEDFVMKRKLLATGLCLTVAATALMGCSNSGSNSEESVASEVAETTETEAAETETTAAEPEGAAAAEMPAHRPVSQI